MAAWREGFVTLNIFVSYSNQISKGASQGTGGHLGSQYEGMQFIVEQKAQRRILFTMAGACSMEEAGPWWQQWAVGIPHHLAS